MSATVPMEFSFGSAGNLKSARRLRNLDLKKQRPTVHPLFGNTGSVVGKAYAPTGGRVGPLYKGAVPTPISGRSTLPLKSGTKLINQGIASSQAPVNQGIDGGGEILPRPSQQNPVIPSGESPQKIVQASSTQGILLIRYKHLTCRRRPCCSRHHCMDVPWQQENKET